MSKRHDELPALLIYKDGRINITNRVFAQPTLKEWERWPVESLPGLTTFDLDRVPKTWPVLERTFKYLGNGDGPYSVYVEVW